MMKILITIGGLIAIAAIAGVLFMYSDTATEEAPVPEPEFVTMQGALDCLPHADTSGPTTLECAYGLKTAEGDYYALDATVLSSGSLFEYTNDETVEVAGSLVTREALPEDDARLKYDIGGVIQLASIVEVEDNEENLATTITGGALSFVQPEDFGLAVTAEQVLASSTIPACSEGFDYCLYYHSDDYADTNFDSAGVRIEQRDDLDDLSMCTDSQPFGYEEMTPTVSTSSTYSTSTFAPLGDAGAGHYSEGALHRLWLDDTCYEFETRIGQSQFENYEEGTIDEFTEADKTAVQNQLDAIMGNFLIVETDELVVFPE